ncbi:MULTISPECIES: cytochrome-c peroxidase [Chitinophagaceae]
MKIWRFGIGLVLMLGLLQTTVSFRRQDKTPDFFVKEKLCDQIDCFAGFVQDTLAQLVTRNVTESQLQQAFLRTRIHYKSIEWAAEYFTYSTAKMINGAPKPELDIASQSITMPNGLQVMEELLFPHYDTSKKNELLAEITLMRENIAILKSYFSNIDIASWQILDATKLEIFRIESLGITGFDNPMTLHSMRESAIALESVAQVLVLYVSKGDTTQRMFSDAATYLNQHTDFNRFDRAFFIRNYANKLSAYIEQLRRKFGSSSLNYNRLLKQDVFTLFDTGAFNPSAYAPFFQQENTAAKILLGKQLFQETAFSGTQTRSCASCHLASRAFASNLIKEKTIDGVGLVDRNTPTLINTALQPQQFYDQRSENIEDQILNVVHNPKEMRGSIRDALQTIKKGNNYKTLIENAYPKKKTLDENDIVESLSAYLRSLVRLNSRFDQYMQGDVNAMTVDEVNGFNLFMGKAQCATCHYMPLFSGVFPPKYMSQDIEVLGVPQYATSKEIDLDRGIYTLLSQQGMYDSLLMTQFDHGFKTVSVRNVSKTAPYMHNGALATLEDVMDFYNEGGGIGKGLHVPNQTLSSDKLNLTPKEIKDIIAFMNALESQ